MSEEPQSGSGDSRLVFSDLQDYPIVAQALDNQWMPPDLSAAQQTAAAWDSQDEAYATADAEFRRAMVNSGTLVVNRAFLMNNPALYRKYLPAADPKDRAAFASFLSEGALVPYLYNEHAPTDEPIFSYAEETYRAWREIAEEAQPLCVRFSWDDGENQDMAAKVNRYFASNIQQLNRLNSAQLAKDLQISPEEAEAMRRGVLRDIAVWAVGEDDTSKITRNSVYAEFFTRPSSSPHQRLLRTGEHIVEAKQLVDLVYNSGVPTLGGVSAYTPPQSPPRSALQELRRHDGGPQDPEQLGAFLTIFRSVFADTLQRAVDGPNSYADLSLADIARLRKETEWREYIDALNDLFIRGAAPGHLPDRDRFAENVRSVAKKHAGMLRRARAISGGGKSTTRSIAMELTLSVPGATVAVVSESDMLLAGLAATVGPAPLVIRMVIRDRLSGRRRDLGHSITFPTLRLRNAKKDMAEIIRVFESQGGRVHRGDRTLPPQADQQTPED